MRFRHGTAMILLATFVSFGSSQWKSAPVPGNGLDHAQLRLQDDPQFGSGKKSVLLAVGLSLILPGAGEWYAGNLSTGRYFMAVDGGLWLTYAGFSFQGTWTRSDARLFATEHGGAVFQGKDEQFDVNIGNYLSLVDYNNAKLRNREIDLLYTGADYQWQWDADANRLTYKGLRIRSDQMFQNARFVLGALIVNRIISAFSAWRSANSFNRSYSEERWGLKAQVTGGVLDSHGVSFVVTRYF